MTCDVDGTEVNRRFNSRVGFHGDGAFALYYLLIMCGRGGVDSCNMWRQRKWTVDSTAVLVSTATARSPCTMTSTDGSPCLAGTHFLCCYPFSIRELPEHGDYRWSWWWIPTVVDLYGGVSVRRKPADVIGLFRKEITQQSSEYRIQNIYMCNLSNP